jgi:hypothetical protein
VQTGQQLAKQTDPATAQRWDNKKGPQSDASLEQ